MTTDYQILNHGYVRFIEKWGSDERIIEAARMSTNKGFQGWEPEWTSTCPQCGYTCVRNDDMLMMCESPAHAGSVAMVLRGSHKGDQALLRFLYEHKHYTPFEMAGLVIEVQAPIMVFREWHRHRTQSYNEMSARYTPLPDVNYLPTVERCLVVNTKNKQAGKASGAAELTHENVLVWLEELKDVYEHAERTYQNGLALGIPKELARLPVPVGRYSRMRACANLRNWLAFLTLRDDKNAQWEIQQSAKVVASFIQDLFPRTYELYVEGRYVEGRNVGV